MPDIPYKPLTIDSYFDRIFYINIAADTDRNAFMLRQFHAFGLKNFERVEGVVLQETPPLAQYHNFNHNEKSIPAQLGCRASHLAAIRLAKERGYRRIMILEDDVQFLMDPNILLQQNAELLQEWDMLYFGGLVESFFRNQIVGAYAYCIQHTLFDNVLYMAEASGMEIDNFYAKILHHMSYNYNQSGKYNIRLIKPFNQIVHSNQFASNMQ